MATKGVVVQKYQHFHKWKKHTFGGGANNVDLHALSIILPNIYYFHGNFSLWKKVDVYIFYGGEEACKNVYFVHYRENATIFCWPL